MATNKMDIIYIFYHPFWVVKMLITAFFRKLRMVLRFPLMSY